MRTRHDIMYAWHEDHNDLPTLEELPLVMEYLYDTERTVYVLSDGNVNVACEAREIGRHVKYE